ncbi:hypothetical protein R1sor_008296 [Riccia sorocarpa]|uniref:Uncharacterized protein n=1 Tax=Riccia sorocarpa TaxID=122646 RepID=A0ABD3HWK5_9MARC
MAAFELNGREIRNAIRNAQALAQSIKEPLGCNHILSATEVLACALLRRLNPKGNNPIFLHTSAQFSSKLYSCLGYEAPGCSSLLSIILK